MDKIRVVITIIFGAMFLGERLTWRVGFGACLIVAGVIVIASE